MELELLFSNNKISSSGDTRTHLLRVFSVVVVIKLEGWVLTQEGKWKTEMIWETNLLEDQLIHKEFLEWEILSLMITSLLSSASIHQRKIKSVLRKLEDLFANKIRVDL